MEAKRIVILFGAGAALGWENAPSTKQLTEIVRNTKFPTKNCKINITEYIYNKLLGENDDERNYLENQINFETIIAAIRELISYYSGFKEDYNSPINQKNYDSLIRRLFSVKVEEDLFNIKNGKLVYTKVQDGIEINGTKIPTKKTKRLDETDEQFVLQILLDRVLNDVYYAVYKYSYQHSEVDRSLFYSPKNNEINELFTNWMYKLKSGSNIIRMYSLNYESMFKTILERNNAIWKIENGFNENKNEQNRREVDLNKLYSDFQSDVFYNLHGNFSWQIIHSTNDGLNCYKVQLSDWFSPPILDSYRSTIQIEKGRGLIISPIILGYQKAENLMLSPFRQIQAAFDKDCFYADEIYIIGYSFGDEHINDILRQVFQHSNNKFYLVDQGYKASNPDKDLKLKILLNVFISEGKKINPIYKDSVDVFYNGKVRMYSLKFKEFMELMNSPIGN